MTLELRHLAPYLPYGLMGYATDINISEKITVHNVTHVLFEQEKIKLILRPLSDLNKTIDLSPYFHQCSDMDGGIRENIFSCPYSDFETLFKHHFDIFGLIDAGLAIDINTIKD